jgi:predicted phage terminase large subunit-like protein
MSRLEREILRLRMRSDLATLIHHAFQVVSPGQEYLHNWHIDAMAWHLLECAEGRITRLLITLPPRHLKSICTSVAFPAWLLGHDPTRRIICASYSAELAGKHANDCRRLIESPLYKRSFPGTRLSPTKNTELNFETTRGGGRFSTSLGGTLTGRGGQFVIIDDPIKPDEAMSETKRARVREWYDQTLVSRLDDKRTDVIIVVMQRVHPEDLAGHVLDKGGWTHLCLPAVAEEDQRIQIGPDRYYLRPVGEPLHAEREPIHVLEAIRADVGSFVYSAQYQQCPVPPDGELIKWSWFRLYDERPRRTGSDMIIQSWDTASRDGELNDYSVCTTWLARGEDVYLLDVVREKLRYPDLKRRVLAEAQKHRPDSLLIEEKGSGEALVDELRRDRPPGMRRPIPVKPDGDKVMRMSAQSAKIEAGHVVLPQSAPWLDELRREILQFPHGRHDDQVDSISQALGWLDDRRRWRVSEIYDPV